MRRRFIRRLRDAVDAELADCGTRVDGYYYCSRHPHFGEVRECDCRKPAPGLILQAQRDFDLDLGGAWLVGDRASDIEAACVAGVRPILVETGYGKEERGAGA